jgi:hypothetical protein
MPLGIGIERVIIPKLNEKDLADVPAEVKQALKFTLVDDVDQVLTAALEPRPASHDGARQRPGKSPNGNPGGPHNVEHEPAFAWDSLHQAISQTQDRGPFITNPAIAASVARSSLLPRCDSGINSSITTNTIAPAAKLIM